MGRGRVRAFGFRIELEGNPTKAATGFGPFLPARLSLASVNANSLMCLMKARAGIVHCRPNFSAEDGPIGSAPLEFLPRSQVFPPRLELKR